MPPLVRRVLLALAVALGIVLLHAGIEYELLSNHGQAEPNRCSMTYMYPSYFPIPMNDITPYAGKYSLFYYRDERFGRASSTNIKKLSGVPLLFIPGNAGSRRQIRSLGSTSGAAYNSSDIQFDRMMTIEDLERERRQFATNQIDYFSIDWDEELTAFNGDLLLDQIHFVSDCINRILKLYESSVKDPSSRPTSVILVGHSMGGMVARAVFTSPTFVSGTVRTILTLSTPHKVAPILLHRGIQSFYSRINHLWRTRCHDDIDLKDTLVVSIAGGFRDGQVHSSLSNLDSVIPCKNHFSVTATSIPDVWIPMDHTSCMWCRQLSVVLSAALAGLIDPHTKQVYESLETRTAVMRRYLYSTMPATLQVDPFSTPLLASSLKLDSSKRLTRNEQASTGIEYEAGVETSNELNWIAQMPVVSNVNTIRVSGTNNLSKYQVKLDLFMHPDKSHLQLVTTLPLDDLQVLLCNAACTSCLDLTKISSPMPYKMKELGKHEWSTLKAYVIVTHFKDYSASEGYQYLIVSAERKNHHHNREFYSFTSSQDVFLVVQITDPSENAAVDSSWLSPSIFPLDTSLISHTIIIDAYKYSLYDASVISLECNNKAMFAPVILSYSPALREERYALQSLPLRFHEQYLSYNYRHNLTDALDRSKDREIPMYAQDGLHIFVFSDPICKYQLSLNPNVYASLDNHLRNFGVLVIGALFAIAILALAVQISHADSHPQRQYQNIIDIFGHILSHGWMIFLLVIFSVPIRMDDILTNLHPLFHLHSYANFSRPWPSFISTFLTIIAALVLLTGWAALTRIVFWILSKFALFIQRFCESPSVEPINGHRRSLSMEATLTSHCPGYWCCVNPALAVTFFGLLSVTAVVLHSSIAVVLALILLLWPTNFNSKTMRFVSPLSPSQEEHHDNMRHGLFVLYSPTLTVLIPDFVVWLKNFHFRYQIFDSYELFAILLSLHIVAVRFTAPSITLRKSPIPSALILAAIVVLVAFFCLFAVYRVVLYVFPVVIAILCLDHFMKVLATPGPSATAVTKSQ